MPPTLLLKLVVTPVLITAATLVGRRWGDALSGWLVGLPLTSGPVIFFLALDQGTRFAATASLGVILGVASQAAFALVYIHVGRDSRWTRRVLAATVAFTAVTVIFQLIQMPVWAEPILVVGCLAAAILVIGEVKPGPVRTISPSMDLPLRVVVATGLVLGLTAIAPLLGARLSGLILPFPLYATVLAVFAHRAAGPRAAAAVWRGLLFGLFSFVAFFTMLAAVVVPAGIGFGFLAAIAVAAAVQAATLLAVRSRAPSRS
ncbi:MAG TPA: hypothetical protein VHW91_00635 [Candidatus Dormibacteraeota bacterium]|nr:hypothetical protein [Candidatus Dormibacteraeota bacterium]